jgi:hypothetical protein
MYDRSHVPYVYRLTDKINGKRYIGSRYARVCEPADLGVKYFTTSKAVEPLFKADPDRFETQIIVTGTIDYVIKVEKDLIEFYDAVMSEDFYNRTNAGAIHPDDISRGGKIGGKIAGQMRIASGDLPRMAYIAGKIGGKISGTLAKKSGQIYELQRKVAGVGGKAGSKVTNSQRWKCLECGLIVPSGPLGTHQKHLGHIGKEKL